MSILSPDSPVFIAAFKFRQHMQRAIERLAADYIAGWKMVWERTDEITPQEIIDKTAELAGSTAIDMFTRSAATRDYIMANRPDLLPEQYRTPGQPVNPEIVNGQPTGRMIVG